MSVSQLKDILRINKQFLSGKKQELINRCIDGERFGALPICSRCGKGRLKLSEDNSKVMCSGYYDEDCGMRIQCDLVDDVNAVERNPWNTEEDLGEQQRSSEQNLKSNKSAQGVQNSKIIAVVNILEKNKHLNMKDLSSKILETCRDQGLQLKLSGDKSLMRQKVGSALLEHRLDKGGFDFSNVIQSLIDQLGLLKSDEPKEEKLKLRANVPANEPIAEVLDEMAKLTAKVGGNQFKVRSLKKSAIALRGLDFKVTSGLELTKGKTKVPGIGKGTGATIDEYLSTGQVQHLIELREEAGVI